MVLLDTHTLIWLLGDHENLSENAIQAFNSDERCVSIASFWEIAIKSSLQDAKRRLVLEASILDIADECRNNDIQILPITPEDCFRVALLPHIHSDPFDRLIVAQALERGIPLITKDERIWKYDQLKKIW